MFFQFSFVVSLYILFFYGKGILFVYDSPSVVRAKDMGKSEAQPFAWNMDPSCMMKKFKEPRRRKRSFPGKIRDTQRPRHKPQRVL